MFRLLAAALLATAACTSTPSGATCPDNQTDVPTYDNFGREFMQTYCTSCHSVNATERHGAPADQNYDSEADVNAHATAIDVEAAAGPSAMNTAMPDLSGPVHAAPTQAEREMLGRYLACQQR